MRIVVNAQTLVSNKLEGLGWFTYEALKRIVANHPEHEFTFVFGKGIDKQFVFSDNVKAVNIGPPYFRPVAWWLKFNYLLPRFINKNNFDLFLSPDGWSSSKIKIKSVVVIHDINFVHFPQFLQKSFCWFYSRYFPQWINHAKRIATVSKYSKQDIVSSYNVVPNKIDVLYNGASSIYRPISEEEQIETRDKYSYGSPYFVFVGALHPRKNIVNQLQAFDEFKGTDTEHVKFVIVGEKFYWNKETNKTYENLKFKEDVIFTGRLNQEELNKVYGSAMALLYVSLFEGFGIPLVEAMNCGIPIITSKTTSMPEIAGNAALIVDPYQISEISEAMVELANNPELRQKLIEAGNIRKNDFSWDKTAEKLWQTVESALSL